MTTIVSSFIGNINKRPQVDYVENGIFLLKTNVPKIIFVDNEMYENIKGYQNDITKLILINKYDSYLYDYIDKLHNFNINSTNNSKDTLEYMFTICYKTEYIKKAIELNYFNTDNFIWIDFGIKHVFNCDNTQFMNKIENISNKSYNRVRIASIWNLNLKYTNDEYTNVLWFFAGGVFGGNKDFLIDFANKTKNMCIKIMEEKNTIMWEVNIWYLIFKENPEIFDYYYCDHNDSIIDNY